MKEVIEMNEDNEFKWFVYGLIVGMFATLFLLAIVTNSLVCGMVPA
jgi:hypothetical protein